MRQRQEIPPIAAIALAALSIRVLAILLIDRTPVSDEADYVSIAQSLLSGGGYSLDGSPTAYRPPGYPTILAGLLWFSDGSLLFVRVFQAMIDTATCLLVYDIGKRLYAENDAVIAAAVYAFFPLQVLYTNAFVTETFFTFLLVLFIRSFLMGRTGWRSAVFPGLLCGAAVLLRPVALILPIVPLAAGSSAIAPADRWRYVGVLSLVMTLVMLPWMGRNLLTFDRFSVTSNTGVNLWVGNHEGANGAFSFPSGNPLDGMRDEFARSDEGARRVIAFWSEDPAGAIVLLPRKFAHLFGIDYWVQMPLAASSIPGESGRAVDAFRRIPPLSIVITHAPFIAASLLALVALFMSPEQARAAIKPLAVLILMWVLIHLVFFGGARYRFPLHPALIVLAVQGWTLLQSRSYRISRARVTVGAVMALLLLAGWTAELWILAP